MSCEQKTYKNSSHIVGVFEALQSLLKDKVLCDIRIETDDGTIIFGHKVVLISVLLAAANLLQIDYVKNVCSEFLQTQLDASNCLRIKAFADLYDCMELSKSSQTYIKKSVFVQVVNYMSFCLLTSVEVIKLISCNDVFVPLEEKVFECVIHWLNHGLDCRKDFLPELMEHVILMLCYSAGKSSVIYWYDNIWRPAPTMSKWFDHIYLTVINDQFVLAMGGVHLGSNCQLVEMLDVSSQSPCWIPIMNMLVNRTFFGVGSLDNCVYTIGGYDGDNYLNNVEVFDINTNKWHGHGVGVLKNLLYVVGGHDGYGYLNTVECYDPCLDTWTPVAAMSECRLGCGVGVLDGVLYVIGGENNSNYLKSIEAYSPSSGIWTTIADMHFCRQNFGVVVLNGLLHIIGGCFNEDDVLNSIEIYNPKTNTWSLEHIVKRY
ncbi:kelch-like protein 20 isoform X1 [Aphis craccivora]|uniref:Kelch-like protein 20 isoform X1 n=1 Tax=Aphis craccivora TaxID=307492 RepID=A0A6G0W3I9_APHCR|nr:kelch-like protein 20 isoform X1 [Aphis craccivora]